MRGGENLKLNIDLLANEIAIETIEYSKVLCNRYMSAYTHKKQTPAMLQQSVINQLIIALIGKE